MYSIVSGPNGLEQRQIVTGQDIGASSRFGRGVAIDGDNVVVGGDDSQAYVFNMVVNGELTLVSRLVAERLVSDSRYGWPARIAGRTVAVGAYHYEKNEDVRTGSVRTFQSCATAPSSPPSIPPRLSPSTAPSDEPTLLPSSEPSTGPSDEPMLLPSSQPSDPTVPREKTVASHPTTMAPTTATQQSRSKSKSSKSMWTETKAKGSGKSEASGKTKAGKRRKLSSTSGSVLGGRQKMTGTKWLSWMARMKKGRRQSGME